MAVIVVSNSSSSVAGANNYISNSSKTTITTSTGEQELVTGINCNSETATEEMTATKKLFNKEGGRTYKHYIQSFNPSDDVSPEQAHQIALEFANNQKFEGYEILVATHTDQDHIHNHFIVNSVNFRTGEKYHESARELQELKAYSNQLSKEYGLTVPQKNEKITANNSRKYRAIQRHYDPKDNYSAEIAETAETIDKIKTQANSWDNFLQLMRSHNYKVKWKSPKTGNEYKYVTYTHPSGKKFRCKNLNNTFKVNNFSKEDIINEISKQQRAREQQQKIERTTKSIDWGAVESDDKNEGNRVSEQPSNEEISRIQREIQEIEEKVAGGPEEEQTKYREGNTRNRGNDQSDIEPDREENRKIEDSKSEPRKSDKPRNQGFER